MTERLLVLVRHGQSEWNLKNLFTGWRDVNLTEQGIAEARAAGKKLKAQGIRFDVAFTSALVRAQRTLDLVLEEMGQTKIPILKDQALNERDYGDLVGLNKDDARKKWGEEQVHKWRRSYDVAPPGGESLRDTVARALPYFVQEILPRVLRGERVLVSAHGNSLRALVMVLEKLSPEAIVKRELGDRRSNSLPAQCRFDRGREGRSRRLNPARLPAEHRALAGQAPVIAGERAVGADHAVAGHHEGDRILSDRRADRARGLARADGLRRPANRSRACRAGSLSSVSQTRTSKSVPIKTTRSG